MRSRLMEFCSGPPVENHSGVDSLVEAIVLGADAMAINAKLKDLEAEQARLKVALNIAPPAKPLLHPNLATLYRTKVEHLEMALRDPRSGSAAIELVRGLIEEVRLEPIDGNLAIGAQGRIGWHLGPRRGSEGGFCRFVAAN